MTFTVVTWGVAPGWYEVAPLALSEGQCHQTPFFVLATM